MSKPDRRLVMKLRSVMPNESTIDVDAHAEIIATTIAQARKVQQTLSLAAAKRSTPSERERESLAALPLAAARIPHA